MGRKGHYVKPGTRATVPGVWFAVVCRTVQRGVRGYFNLTEHTMETAECAVIYRTRRGWTHPETVRVSTGEALREWMHAHSLARRVNWVITPRVDETLTLSEWFCYAEAKGIVWGQPRGTEEGVATHRPGSDPVHLERFIVSPTVGIVRHTDRGRLWQWVGVGQYGGAVGVGGGREGAPGQGDNGSGRGGVEARGESDAPDAGQLVRSAAGLCDWWRTHARAGFGLTVSGLAHGVMRSHLPPRTLLVHQCEDAHQLERSAAFGGRQSVWFVGAVGDCPYPAAPHVSHSGNVTPRHEPGPLVNLDYRAMYPSIIADNLLPTKLHNSPRPMTPRQLDQLIDDWGVVARVTIRTRRAEYPYRTERGVAFPLGTFTTTLTGPELATLRADGEVITCHSAATYHLSDALAAGARFLLQNRTAADSADGAGASGFAKLLANSLCGRLAMRAGGWVREESRDLAGRWGEAREVNAQTGKVVRRRWVCGLCWRWDEDKTGRGPHTAAFAYVTALGRVQMRRVRERIGDRGVVSQDTDGIWCLEHRIRALGPIPSKADARPGQLSNRGSVRSARFWSPQHYWTDDGWTLSGFHGGVAGAEGVKVWVMRQGLPWVGGVCQAPRSVITETRQSDLLIEAPFGTVQPDGWIIPRNIFPRKESSASAG